MKGITSANTFIEMLNYSTLANYSEGWGTTSLFVKNSYRITNINRIEQNTPIADVNLRADIFSTIDKGNNIKNYNFG
jgi:hypothetical protein